MFYRNYFLDTFQTAACVKEAERFEYLIKSRSPSVTSNLLLTPLIYAKLRTHVMTMTSAASAFYTQPVCLVTLTLLLLHFSHKIRGFVWFMVYDVKNLLESHIYLKFKARESLLPSVITEQGRQCIIKEQRISRHGDFSCF